MIVKNGWKERSYSVDCVLVACHGGAGENGSLSGYFETVGMPYTASEPFGCSLFMDKDFTKDFLSKNRFPVLRAEVVKEGEGCPDALDYPVIVKPARLGSSIGISVAKDEKELKTALDDAFVYDEKVLIEPCLRDFREFNCAAFRRGEEIVCSEVEEPVFKKEYLDFYDKYTDASEAKRDLPAQIDEKLREEIRKATRRIYSRAELKGIVRVDYLYADKKLFVNEVNAVPGALGLYLFVPTGILAEEVLEAVVNDAIRSQRGKESKTVRFSSGVLREYAKIKEKGVKGIKGIKK